MKTRLQHIVKNEGLTNQRFAAEIGISPAAVTHILSGRNNPSLEIIAKIAAKYPHYALRWLILGELPILASEMADKGLNDISETANGDTISSSANFEHESNASISISETDSVQNQLPFFGTTTPTEQPQVPDVTPSSNRSEPDEHSASAQSEGESRLIICFPDGTYREYLRQK
jgi:transcriptional regulator with XRE-family HTH domain